MAIKKTFRNIILLTIILLSTCVLKSNVITNDIRYKVSDISNNKKYLVTIREDLVNQQVTISNMTNTICIANIAQIDSIYSLNKNFLIVIASMRGGSGVKVKRAVIFSINNKKLFKSLDLESEDISSSISESGQEFLNESYKLTINKFIDNIQSRFLELTIRNNQSKYSVQLNFDISKMIFYDVSSGKSTISGDKIITKNQAVLYSYNNDSCK